MSRRTKDEHGAAAVEFALVLPFLLVLIFGAINFGVLFAQNLAMNNAARDAARLGAVENTPCEEIADAANDGSASLAMDSGDVNWNYTCGSCEGTDPGASFEVTGNYDSPFLVPMPIPGFPDSVELTAHGEFKCEYS